MSQPHSPFIPIWMDELDLKPIQFRVLCHLWRRAGKDGRCYPSAPVIAKSCLINRDTVWPTLTALEEAGLLVKMKKRFGTANTYLLKVPIGGNEPPIDSLQSAEKDGRLNDCQSAETEGRQSAETEGRKGSKGKGLKRNQTSTLGSNSAPHGTASSDSAQNSYSLEELLQLSASVHETARRDPGEPLGMFPPEEVAGWVKQWHTEMVATDYHFKGSKIKNPVAALKSYLRSTASNQSKRFKEINRHAKEDTPPPF